MQKKPFKLFFEFCFELRYFFFVLRIHTVTCQRLFETGNVLFLEMSQLIIGKFSYVNNQPNLEVTNSEIGFCNKVFNLGMFTSMSHNANFDFSYKVFT